jgi:hypothetical protein
MRKAAEKVSRDLLIGRNPLWVAKQHGHSLLTMLRVYAAWTADASEKDVWRSGTPGVMSTGTATLTEPAAFETVWQ